MKKLFLWILAVAVTLAAVVYQRKTGPTNPIQKSIGIEGKTYTVSFARSLETEIRPLENGTFTGSTKTSDFEFEMKGIKEDVSVIMYYKRYPSKDEYTAVTAEQTVDLFTVKLPSQPPAGKIQYYITLSCNGQTQTFFRDEPVVLRFRNSVPVYILLPHILLMFLAMLFANYTGIISFTSSAKVRRYALWTIVTLALGGLVFGPFVQYYAFGSYWTGWPLGSDLTDNKTLIMFIVWLVAILMNRKKTRKYLYIAAALLTLAVYSIPHSLLGSEYKYQQEQQGR
jgi:hypothetical protein